MGKCNLLLELYTLSLSLRTIFNLTELSTLLFVCLNLLEFDRNTDVILMNAELKHF